MPNIKEIWEPKPRGTLWATPGLLRESFTFFLLQVVYTYRVSFIYTDCTSCRQNTIQYTTTEKRLAPSLPPEYRTIVLYVWNGKGQIF